MLRTATLIYCSNPHGLILILRMGFQTLIYSSASISLMTRALTRTSRTNHQTRLNDYSQPRTASNAMDWYNRPTRIHGQPNHNLNFKWCPATQIQQLQPRPAWVPATAEISTRRSATHSPNPLLGVTGKRAQMGYAQYEQNASYQPHDYGQPPMRGSTVGTR